MKRLLSLSAALVALLAIAAPRAQASCATTVTALPGALQSQINSIPGTVGPGDYCIQLNSGGAFNEVIDIPAHTFADQFSRIIISSGIGASPLIYNSSSTGAIFNIYSDSVTLNGVWIQPNSATQSGVEVNASYVKLTNVSVADPSALFTGAGVKILGNYDEIFGSSVAARSTTAYGVLVAASSYGAKVVQSTVSAQGTGGQSALDLDSSGALVSNSYIEQLSVSNATGLSVQFTSGTQILASTVTIVSAFPTTNTGIYLNNAGNVTMSSVAVLSAAIGVDFHATSASTMTYATVNAAGHGVYLEGSSNNDVISYSTITNTNSGAAVEVQGASNLWIDWSVLYKSNNSNNTFEAQSGGGGGHVISHSSVTCNAGGSYGAVYFNQPNGAVSDSFLSANFGPGLAVDNVSGITVAKSTMTSRTNSQGTLWLNNASNASISKVSVFNPDGDALRVEVGASANSITLSTFTSYANFSGRALSISNSANNNTFSGDVFNGGAGSGGMAPVLIQNSANNNVIDASKIANPSGAALLITGGPHHNTISNTTITASTIAAAGFGGAVLVTQSSSNTFVNDSVSNSLVSNGLYVAQSSSMTILGGSYGIFSGGTGNGAIVFDNTHNSSITNATVTSGSGQALYLFNSSSNNISGLYVQGAGAFQAALLSSAVSNAIFTSSVTNTGTGHAMRIIGGGNDVISGSTMTAAVTGSGLRVDNSNGNAVTASVVKSSSGTALLLFTSNSNIVSGSSLVTNSTGAFSAYEDNNGSSNQLANSLVQALASTQAAVHLFNGVASDNITNSTITALAGAGIYADLSSNLTVFATSVQGSTGVWFNNVALNAGNGFYGDVITGVGSGKAGLAITNAPAGSTTTVNNTVVSGSGTVTYGLLHNGSPSAVLQLTSNNTIHGWADIVSGGLTASGGSTSFLGDVTLGPGVFTNVTVSTFGFYGATEVPARAAQTLDIQAVTPPVFYNVDLNVASFTAKGNSFNAVLVQDNVAASTAAFAAATASPYFWNNLNLRGGTGANQRVVFRSLTPGTAMKLTIGASTVTLAMIQDSDASTGVTVHANDASSVNAGNDTNWNFAPQLSVELPGETWTEGVGKSGFAGNQPAGSVPVTVRAVSNGNTTLNTNITVSLSGNQLYDASGTQPLQNGTTVFNLVLPKAGITHILTATSTQAYSGTSYIDSLIMNAAPFTRLLALLNGESADAGSATGRTGTPTAVVAGAPYSITVYAADLYNNTVSGGDLVQLSTSGANLPQSQTLAAGFTTFSNVVFASSAAARDVVAMDLSNGSIKASTSTVFGIFAPTSSSPTVSVNIANNSIQTSLGGQISGTASDPTGVTGVSVQLVRSSDQNYFDWVAGFTVSSISSAAALSAPGGLNTGWVVGVADANLAAGTTYYLVVKSNNASGNQVVAYSTFTFNPSFGQAGSLGDGEGSAAVGFRSAANPVVPSSVGCGPIIASMTFVAGPHGINNGGAIAVHLPDAWSAPTSTAAAFGAPPVAPGTLLIQAPFSYTIDLSPTTQSGATFGANWFVYRPTQNIPPGASVNFKVSAFTGGGPQAVGPQTFLFQTQGGPGGQFKPIAQQPAAGLNAGPADSLQFSNQQFMTLGPLQTSSTMQLVVNDACGNSTNTATSVTANFNAFANGAVDAGGQFYQGASPVSSIVIPGNSHTSPAFYFVTSTPGPFFEQLSADAVLTSNTAYATRYAQVLASSVSITGVSVDTGTLAAGVKVTTITPGSFSGGAVFNFTLSNPNTPWELIISTSPSTFFPEIVHRNGYGQPGRSVTWNGITETTFPQTLVKPGGPYFVKIRVGGGVVEDNSLAVFMAPSAYVYGTVASTGAFAYVQAQGPNTSFANFAVASSTGYFEIFGLQNGGRYNIVATTGSVINGQFVQLQTSSNNVTAANTGTNVGSIPFPTPTFLRLRVQIPQPAPFEFWGGFNAFSTTGQNAWGTLHYLPGLDKSDDGSQSFGAGSASTWTVVGVTPGIYNLQVNLPQVSISSQLPNVSIPAGTTTDLFLALQRKANVYGWAVVPSSTQYGTWVSVQAQKAGEPRPTVFGGTFLQGYQFGVPQSSNVYSLFGLDPGSWTITARAPGFASASNSLFISSNADVGDQVNGGFNLTLTSGAVLNGVLQIFGDSSNLPQASNGGLTVYINAFNPQTYSNGFAQVFISTVDGVSPAFARSTFSITGLDQGTYFLNTWVQGAQAPQISTTVTSAGGFTTMNLGVDNARAAVTVLLPPSPPPDFHKVGMFYQGMNVQPTAVPDFQALPGVTVFTTSATWISPKFSPGYFGFMAADTVHGTFATTPVQIRNGGTTPAVIDLRGSTFTVSGTVVVAGNVDFNLNGAAVSVSSVAGVLANAVPAEYCLAGHATSVTSSTFHLELLPVARQGSYWTDPLITLPAAGGCPTQLPFANNHNGDVVNPLLAYVVSISTDGSFTIPNVPPGSYVLRVPTSLGNSGFGNELPPVHQFISVTTSSVSGLTFTISRGVSVSGNLRLPPGLQSSRGMQVSINDANGTQVKTSFVSFSNSNSASYTLDRVPDGSYALVVQDFGYPRSFGARPVTLKVSGAAINQDIQLVQTGVIKGKLAVQQFLPNSTTAQFVLIDAHNADQLPNSFNVYAEANPWFQGGRTPADSGCGAAGGGPCGGFGKPNFDENGQFSISGVLPGLYDIHFESHNDPTEQSTIRLVTSLAPGVSVNGGATTDMGTHNLTSALSLRGKVTDATTNNPIANMPVTAQPALSQNHDVDRPDTTTDANGNYTLVGLDPATKVYDIYAGKRQDHTGAPPPPYELKIAPSVDVTSVAVQNFAMTPASFSISGLIKGAPGGPALTVPFGSDNGTAQLGAGIFLQKSGVQPHDNPIADVMEQTDPQGRFRVPSLTTGTYRLTVVSLGYTSYSQNVTITTQSVTVPTITLGQGATLTGALRKPDGSNPSQREIDTMVAVTNNFSQLLVATLTPDSNANTYTNYSIAGFQPGVSYKVLIFGKGGTSAAIAPSEGQNIVFSTTTETRSLDMVLRPAAPYVFSKSKKSSGKFSLRFELSQPLRNSRPNDNDLASILSTFSALGSLSNLDLDATRSILTAQYTPGVSESSFTIRIHGYSTQTDPDSLDPVNPQFVYDSTFSFFNGIDGYYANVLSNFNGGTLLVEDDNGRVSIPGGAFQVDASSSVSIGLALSNEALSGAAAAAAAGYKGAAANIKAMRYSGSAYPQEIFRAMAATPPQVSPLSSFYNILLPLGIRTALQKPVPLTISYSTNTDPTTLNLYWYNAAANAYVLQQDVTGAKPVIDTLNHTITINVNHFSTFVMFNTGVAVITGNTFGGEFTAYNFPNPFDLSVKNVTATHGAGGTASIRGTQISIGLPPDISGDGSIRIFNVAGEKVRTISLGTLQGGSYYYQPWDGRNDSGRDCASGVYIGQVKVGDRSKFFKMALIK